jgi:hypothetical protein
MSGGESVAGQTLPNNTIEREKNSGRHGEGPAHLAHRESRGTRFFFRLKLPPTSQL